jgi:archaeosortase B (VPXXXP-CTERM-specific)
MTKKKSNPKKKSMRQRGHVDRDLNYLKIPLLFCLVAALSNLLFYLIYKRENFSFFEVFTAQATTAVIHLFGMPAVRDNTIIRLTNAEWAVNTECTAITIMIIFTSFIVVYPASFKAKSVGTFLGLPVIFTANIMRLLLMAVVDKYNPRYATMFHDYIWQVAFIIMVVLMWMVWMDKVAKDEAKTVISD